MRHKRALLAVLIIALTGAFLIPSVVFAALQRVLTFDSPGSDPAYVVLDGAISAIAGRTGSGLEGNAESATIRRAQVRIDTSFCTQGIDRVVTYVKYSHGSGVQNIYERVQFMDSGFNLLHNREGAFLLTKGDWYPVTVDVDIVAAYVALMYAFDISYSGVRYVYLDDIHVVCNDTAPEFGSTPAAGGIVSVGVGEVGTRIVNANAMQISNTGDSLLLSSFAFSGPMASEFEMVTDSPLGVTAGNSAAVVIACTPSALGERSATLTVETNDLDEPTNTYTVTCNSEPSAEQGNYLGTCLAMGQAATFATGWTTLGGAGNPPGTQRGMMLPPGSEASYSLSLQPTWQYGIALKYRSTAPQDGQTFRLRLGAHPGFDVPVINDTDLHTYEVPGGNYRPDQFGGYTLRLNGPASDTGLIVDYVCVTQRQIAGADPGQGGGGIGGVDATCEACVYEPASREIDVFGLAVSVPDLSAIIDWLFCGLRRVIECELLPAIQGIWSMVTDTVKFLSSFRGLFDGIVTLVSDATVGNLGALGTFGGAHMNNVGGLVGNAFYDAGLADAQNQIVGGVNNVAPSVANALGGLNGGGGAASSPTASGDALADPLGGIITAFGYLFTMVPQFIGSMIDGLNTSAYVPVSGSITCSNPGVILYYPCLGFYVADNTIFQGPAMYLIPILMAVLAWDTLTWAIAKFKEAFSR